MNVQKRNMLHAGSLTLKRSCLKERLKIESELNDYKKKLRHGNFDKNASYCAKGAVHCSLHVEN